MLVHFHPRALEALLQVGKLLIGVVAVDPILVNPSVLILWMDGILHQFETMGTMVRWYVQGTHHSRASFVAQDFVRPQY